MNQKGFPEDRKSDSRCWLGMGASIGLMANFLLVALAAIIATAHGAPDGQRSRPQAVRGPAGFYIVSDDDTHETKPPDVIRVEPADPNDNMPKVFTPAAPAAPAASTCITPAGNCALRAPASIGSTCSCQSKTARVFGTAQ